MTKSAGAEPLPPPCVQKELRYHRTGVPELNEDDRALIGECLVAIEARARKDPAEGRRFLKFVLGSGPL